MDARDYILTVESAHGSPEPAAGEHAYCWRSTVTASVSEQAENPSEGDGDALTCTGWRGTGSVPAEGATRNTGEILLTDVDSSITWLWDEKPTVTSISGMHFSKTEKAFFLEHIELEEEVAATINWAGEEPGEVRWYAGDMMTAVTSVSGDQASRTFDMGWNFRVGECLYVQAVSRGGIEGPKVEANFEVVPVPPGMEKYGLSFQQPNSTAKGKYFSCPFSAGFPEVAADKAPVATNSNKLPEIAQFEFTTVLEVTMEVDTAGHAEMKFASDALKKKEVIELAGMKMDATLNILLTLDFAGGDWQCGGGFELGVSGRQTTTPVYIVFPVGPVPVPVYYRFAMDASVAAKCAFTGGQAELPIFRGNIPVNGGGEAMGGVGIADCLALEAYLRLGLNFDFQVPQEPYLKDWYLSGKGGTRIHLVLWMFKNEHLSYRWPEAGRGMSWTTDLIAANMAPMDRDYLDGGYALWLGGRGGRSLGPETVLQSNVFGQSDAALAVSGGTKCLVWLYDEPGRNSLDRTMLVYSINQGDGWSEPQAIDDDGTADAMPDLAVDGSGNFVCVWANAASLLPDGTELGGFADALDVRMAVLNAGAGTWTTETVSDAPHLDHDPKVVCNDDSITFVWTHDDDNDLLAEADAVSNTLMVRTKTGTSWGAATSVATVDGYVKFVDIDADSGGNHIVYCVDTDSDLRTDADNELFHVTDASGMWSSPQRLTNDTVTDINPQLVQTSAGDLMLIWARDGRIVSSADLAGLTGIAEVVAQEGSSGQRGFVAATSPAGNVSAIWSDTSEAGVDIYSATYDPTAADWSAPVRITSNRDQERSITAAYASDDCLTLAYNKVHIGEGEGLEVFGQVDLCVSDYTIGRDVETVPGSIEIDDPDAVPGDSTILRAQVRNSGDLALADVSVAFYCGNEAVADNRIGDVVTLGEGLLAGETAEVSVEWTIPASAEPLSVIVVADPEQALEDRDRANNTVSATLLGADLALRDVRVRRDENGDFVIAAELANAGYIQVTETVTVSVLAADGVTELYSSQTAFDAASGETCSLDEITIPAGDLAYGLVEVTLEVAVADEFDEASLLNNSRVLYLDNACDGAFEGDSLDSNWTTAGVAGWAMDSGFFQEGNSSARSGEISDDQSTSLEVTLDDVGFVSFWYKVSSEEGHDCLEFHIDGVKQGNWSGNIDWTRQEYALTAGTHTFRWVYSKDSSGEAGDDAAWIDDVVFSTETPLFSVDFVAGEHGSIVAGEVTQQVGLGETAVAPTVEADSGYVFAGWDVDVTDVRKDTVAVAQYTPPWHVSNLTAAQRPGTKLVDITYDVVNNEGATVDIELAVANAGTAVPCPAVTGDAGSDVSTGTGKTVVWDMAQDWNGEDADLTFSVTASVETSEEVDSRSVAAFVDSRDYILTVESAHGSPEPAAGEHAYCWRSTVICQVDAKVIEADGTWRCVGWTGTGGVPAAGTTGDTGDIVLSEVASSITWNWEGAPSYLLTVTGGTGNGRYEESDAVSLAADVPAGQEFAGWTVEPAEFAGNLADATSAITTFTMPAADVTLRATYAPTTYTVTFDLGAHGARIGGGELTQTVEHGAAVEAPEIEVAAGWLFAGWDVPFDDVTEDLTVTAQYADDKVTVFFVRRDAVGAGDGSSWADAFTELQPAIEACAAAGGGEVWVAAGVYKPTSRPNGGDEADPRTVHFSLRNNVAVYGGFPADAIDGRADCNELTDRDWHTHRAILSGDIGNPDTDADGDHIPDTPGGDSGDNAYHVFYHPETATLELSAVMNGVTVTAGRATMPVISSYNDGAGMLNDHCSPKLQNSIFVANYALDDGGGMLNLNSSPRLTQCIFSGNSAGEGGGIYNKESSPIIVYTVFSANMSAHSGGGVFNMDSSPLFINCLFSGNSADGGGGGMINHSSAITVSNSVFSNNTALFGGGMSSYYTSPTVKNSAFYGNSTEVHFFSVDKSGFTFNVINLPDLSGWPANNISGAPLFVAPGDPVGPDGLWGTADDGLRLQAGSPCIDAGDNAAIAEGVDIDMVGNFRIANEVVDIGAYEYGSSLPLQVTYHGNGNTGGTVPVDDAAYREGDTVTVLGNTGGLVKDALLFAGWNTAYDGGGSDYAPNATFAIGGDSVELYAQWGTAYGLAVVNGTGSGDYPEGTVVPTSADPPPAGAEFANWTIDPAEFADNLADALSATTTFTMPAADVTLTALYEPIPVDPLWALAFAVQGAEPATLTLGMHPDATDVWDEELDVLCALAGPGQACLVSDDLAVSYSTDYRAVADAGEFLLLVSAGADAPATLSWATPELPEGKYLTAYEVAVDGFEGGRAPVTMRPVGNTAVNMALCTSLDIPAGETRWYRIRYGSDLVFDLAFEPGWNLIALPLEPAVTSVDQLLSDNSGTGETGRDAGSDDEQRETIHCGAVWSWAERRYIQASDLHACVGYWVFVRQPARVLVTGLPVGQEVFHLQCGWNLCGVEIAQPVPDHPAITGMSWHWDSAAQTYRQVHVLLPGWGYWIPALEPVSVPSQSSAGDMEQ